MILHHFDLSPFSEKIRLMMGYKGAHWESVKIPMLMPKPDLVALTGGHRRTPVLQMGADVWCDTALISKVLDRKLPGPQVHLGEIPVANALAKWADWFLFWSVVDFASQPACLAYRFGHLSEQERAAIAQDRNPFRASVPKLSASAAAANLNQFFTMLEAQLGVHQPHLFGVASIADFSVAHCVWHLRRAGPLALSLMAPYVKLMAWHDRMLGLGHGRITEISASDALSRSRQATHFEETVFIPEPGLTRGQQVLVAAVDYGFEHSMGALIGLNPDEIVIEHEHERAGQVHVHFPRLGFDVKPA